jgi:Flp pilus assembly protein TadB
MLNFSNAANNKHQLCSLNYLNGQSRGFCEQRFRLHNDNSLESTGHRNESNHDRLVDGVRRLDRQLQQNRIRSEIKKMFNTFFAAVIAAIVVAFDVVVAADASAVVIVVAVVIFVVFIYRFMTANSEMVAHGPEKEYFLI